MKIRLETKKVHWKHRYEIGNKNADWKYKDWKHDFEIGNRKSTFETMHLDWKQNS